MTGPDPMWNLNLGPKEYTKFPFLVNFHETNLDNIRKNGYSIEKDNNLEQLFINHKRSKLYIPNGTPRGPPAGELDWVH